MTSVRQSPDPSANLFIQWIPEFSQPDAIFRIERERQGLWAKLKQLLPENPWIQTDGEADVGSQLVFERAVHAAQNFDRAADATEFQFVHYDAFREDSVRTALLAQTAPGPPEIQRKRLVSQWIQAIYTEEAKITGSRANRLIEMLANLGTSASCRSVFFELLRLLSQTRISGYLWKLAVNQYFSDRSRPLGYFGTVATETLLTTLYRINASADVEAIAAIENQTQKLESFNGTTQGEQVDTLFQKGVINVIHAHSRNPERSASDLALLILPVFSINPRLAAITSPACLGTFSGFLYFLAPLTPTKQEGLKTEIKSLLQVVLPLLDDFASDLRSGEGEEAIEMRYRSDHVAAPPIEFLQQHLHTFSGWRVVSVSTTEANGAFQWNGTNLDVALPSKDGTHRQEVVRLEPSPTTSVPENDNVAAQERLGYHVATHLQQIYRELCYIHNVAKVEELQKFKQMLELLQKPLKSISGALSTMQSESQELRAILFEPEEALFASHAAITPFFKEGATLPLDGPWAIGFRIKHLPSQYTEDDARLVLSCLLCAVFGELDKIKTQPHRDLVVSTSVEIIGGKAASEATLRFSRDLAWLVSGNDQTSLSNFLSAASKMELSNAIRNIKDALFSPYKAMSTEWHPIAFRLLIRNEVFDGCDGIGMLAPGFQSRIQLPETPVTCASVLAFLRDITLALRAPDESGRATRTPTRLEVKAEDLTVTLSLAFSKVVPDSRDGLEMQYFRKNLRIMANRAPREWRVQSDHYGDRTRPFVFLINKILGLGEKTDYGWNVGSASDNDLFVCEKRSSEKSILFSLGVTKDRTGLFMKWRQERKAV